MAVVFAGLMCHAPIVVPLVGGRDAHLCQRSTKAMRDVAQRLLHSKPDRVVLVSPHSPRLPDACAAWRGRHRGDLADFRAPAIKVDLPDAPEVAGCLDLATPPLPAAWALAPDRQRLDHGAVVPLSFLWQAGWRGPTAILSLPGCTPGPDTARDIADLGQSLRKLPGRTAVVASGDMSHRLKPGAPAGFHPQARDFDRAFVAALSANDWKAAIATQPRACAAEDVVESTRLAMAAAGRPEGAEVLCYEGPFGVGYTEAILFDPAPPLYAVARRAIHDQLAGRNRAPPQDGPPSAGVFVSLHRCGTLRGCIGHIEPRHSRLYQEVAEVARLAAARDPRFPAVGTGELDDLDIEVSVLDIPEVVEDFAQLDPSVYGVIVTAGRRSALLLPALRGLDTVSQQLSAVRRKAGIGAEEPIHIQRFTVNKSATP